MITPRQKYDEKIRAGTVERRRSEGSAWTRGVVVLSRDVKGERRPHERSGEICHCACRIDRRYCQDRCAARHCHVHCRHVPEHHRRSREKVRLHHHDRRRAVAVRRRHYLVFGWTTVLSLNTYVELRLEHAVKMDASTNYALVLKRHRMSGTHSQDRHFAALGG